MRSGGNQMAVWPWESFSVVLPVTLTDDATMAGICTGNILKFADDTKLFRKTKEIGDKRNLQDGIGELVRWSENGRI